MAVTRLDRRAIGLAAIAGVFVMASAVERSTASSGLAAIYTPAQATLGSKIYAAQCALCHGAQLEGNVGPALTGQNLRTLAKNTKLTVGDLFQFMALQMPLNEPATLKHDQYAALMAFILKVNGYPAGAKSLTYDEAMNSKVKMTSLK